MPCPSFPSLRWLVLAAFLQAPVEAAVTGSPVSVSPGLADRFVLVADRCPTFTWYGTAEIAEIELLVYRVEQGAKPTATAVQIDSPALRVRLPGGATAWTPPVDLCLQAGARYSWLIRGAAAHTPEAAWSELLLFEVQGAPTSAEVEEALQVLRRYLGAAGGTGRGGDVVPIASAAAGEPRGGGAAAAEGPRPHALETFSAALQAELPDTTGQAHGLVGISHSPEGAGVVADNTAGGADVKLGAAVAAESAALTEESFERASADDLVFEFRNSGSGSMTLRVDAAEVLTAASGSPLAHGHAGEDITSGTVAETRIDAAIARDAEILPTVLGGDGSGSTLDADLLDGLDASDFAPAAGSASYVAKGGDTMIGTLNLPADGLVAGTDQLVLSGGNVGVGTVAPAQELEVAGDAAIGGSVETLDNAGFTLDGDDLFVAGTAGVEGTIYTDSGLTVGASTTYADGSITQSTDGSGLTVDVAGGDTAGENLVVTANNVSIDAAGMVTASEFVGGGAGLTGITADTASDLACAGCVAEGELDFDSATQAELDAHKLSGDHDALYVNAAGDTMTNDLDLGGNDLLAVGTASLSGALNLPEGAIQDGRIVTADLKDGAVTEAKLNLVLVASGDVHLIPGAVREDLISSTYDLGGSFYPLYLVSVNRWRGNDYVDQQFSYQLLHKEGSDYWNSNWYIRIKNESATNYAGARYRVWRLQ